jgi:hypothetical protein
MLEHPPRDVPDVAGIAYNEIKRHFQDSVNRLPVNASTLHRHMGATFGYEPVSQSK